MNDGIIVDASIGLSWVHPAQATEETSALLSAIASGCEVLVPSLWFIEMANALLILERRKQIKSEERRRALARLQELNFSIDDGDPRVAFGAASDLAAKFRLTVYDATYLELALRRNMRLATRDGRLTAAARQAGIRTVARDSKPQK